MGKLLIIDNWCWCPTRDSGKAEGITVAMFSDSEGS